MFPSVAVFVFVPKVPLFNQIFLTGCFFLLLQKMSEPKEDRKRRKELIKALETPEQKRLRRLEKKNEKDRRRKEMMGWDEEYIGYTNDDNPFGDSNLHDTFVWKKKYEKLGYKQIDEEEINQINKKKMVKNKQELEKVKQRRLEREKEREVRMEELSKMQRDKEAEQFKEWAKQEDYFHLKQAKLRSKLRIKECRAKPIDILARYINVFGENVCTDCVSDSDNTSDESSQLRRRMRRDEEEEDLTDRIKVLSGSLTEPYNTLNGLRIRDMEDLLEDIRIYLELDSGAKINADYWQDLQIIVEDELAKLKLANMDLQERRREGINPSVSSDIASILRGKTPQQLKVLQGQVERKISSKEEGIDIGYWETLLSRLRAQIARARLREFHETNLTNRSSLIDGYQRQLRELRPTRAEECEFEPIASTSQENVEEVPKEDVKFFSNIEFEQKCIQDYGTSCYSPKPMAIEDVNSECLVLSFEDYSRDLDEQRTTILKKLLAFPTPFVQFDRKKEKKEASYDHNVRTMTRDEEAFVKEARKGMNDDEAIFSVEEELIDESELQRRKSERQPQACVSTGMILLKDRNNWSEKYRPRKPRYFNRVHTGFEWNKYNQTHYDVDNPPPKVVQGYKFNIFYPDLIDKSSTPAYKITPCPDNKDFAYIRFTAGPPYEDICFKIVNREWNYSYKSGFRSQFQNNILQLWFHFKRYRYRR